MNNKIKRNYSDHIINLIRRDLADNIPISHISRKFEVSRKFIYTIKNDVPSKERGRPKQYDANKLTMQCKKSILKSKKQKKRSTATNIMKDVLENVSIRTLQTFLNKTKAFKLRNFKKKIVLNDVQKSERVNTITSWFEDNVNFKSVIFSDECRFSLDGPDSFLSWDLYEGDGDGIRQKRMVDGGGIMIYGFVESSGYLHIEKIDGTMDSKKYLNLMQEKVMNLIRERNGTSFIYQQDNARPHTAKIMKQYFENEQINVLKWPSRSPDLSIIENVWKIMKDYVYESMAIENLSELWQRIQMAEVRINEEKGKVIQNMYKSIVKRYLKVLKNGGSNKL